VILNLENESSISISPENIKDQLDKILSSELFENKIRLQRFLSFVTNETLDGNAKLIKGYTLGLEVFDKDETFDPGADAIVRVEAGRLRRLLEHYYMGEGKDDKVIINLPKGKYEVFFNKTTKSNEKAISDPILNAAAAPPTGPAIAVMPFESFSEQKNMTIFADGITEEIISQLSMSPSLYVISRKVTSYYKGKSVDIRELSKELETHYVLEGSIRQGGDNVRVSAQLLNGTNGSIIWSEKYDRILNPENIIAVQDEIARHVSATIGDAYGTIMRNSAIDMKRSSTEFMDAYKSMLLFHDYLFELSESSHLKARESLEKAIEIDPHYADAWAGLSFLTLDEYRFSFNVKDDPTDALDRAQQLAEKSISLSSQYSIAWYAMTIIHYHKGELDKFQNNIKMGLSIAPNSPAVLADSGVYLCLMGEMEQGLSLVKKAMALNPQHPNWCQFALFHNHFLKGEFDKAAGYISTIETPDWFWPHALQAIIFTELGDEKSAERAKQNVLRLYPKFSKNALDECSKWFQREQDTAYYLESFKKAGLMN
jgi:TolB-like protein/tetratricopeptide (TPR) repeat protein